LAWGLFTARPCANHDGLPYKKINHFINYTPFYKRGTSFGVFNTGYGLALLIGSALMGRLYDLSQTGVLIAFTCAAETIAVFPYVNMIRTVKAAREMEAAV